jgi:transcription elongation factor
MLFFYIKIKIQIVLLYRADKVGVVTRIEKDRLHVLNMDGKVQLLQIQSITKRRINRNATALDSQNNNLNVGDIVNVVDGPFAVRIFIFSSQIYLCSFSKESSRTNQTYRSSFCFYILSNIN